MKFNKGQFGYDLEFFKKHAQPMVLSSINKKQQLIISPEHQARVITSTADGLQGTSFGWVNHDLISSKKLQKHINPFGGEDRIWLGPEAGQFGLFFNPGSSFDSSNYQVPAPLDCEPFELIKHDEISAEFLKEMSIINYSNTRFEARIQRTITLLTIDEITAILEVGFEENLAVVGFESVNKLTNIGTSGWNKDSGLLSIWILGMFNASNQATVMIPIVDSNMGINSNYFGDLDSQRLQLRDNTVYFSGDGNYRSKIGIPPGNARNVFGSVDFQNDILTIVQFSRERDGDYVNSLWELQGDPYSGDVINSYNDGPDEEGNQLGKFYELETSSAASALSPGESITHTHRTFHFQAEKKILGKLSNELLGDNLSKNRK